jgi:hydroxymethylpyrimidine pyrophosphatase-like HAD family hydrolase
MLKKFFFFDIDHTLGLDISSIIPADTVYCLHRLKQSGHFVSIATGRLQCDAQRFADNYGIGAVVSDGGNSLSIDGTILEMNGLPLTDCKALLHELDTCHLPWAVVADNTPVRYTPYAMYPHADSRNYMKTITRPIDIDSLTAVYKIMYVRPESGQPVPSRHRLPHLPYLDNTWLIEPIDKGAGISRMMNHLNADPADAVVFGGWAQ